MNFTPFIFFSKHAKSNRVLSLVRDIKKHSVFKGAHFDFYTPSLHPEHLVVVIGQSHPVLTGSVNNRQFRQIVSCQAKLVLYYGYFHQVHGITTFGAEGLHGDKNALYLASGNSEPLFGQAFAKFFSKKDKMKLSIQGMHQVAKKILAYYGGLWREGLRFKNPRNTQKYASCVDGTAFYDFLTPAYISVFPVEGEKQYQFVLKNVREIEKQIARIENDPDYKTGSAKLKRRDKGQKYTDKEIARIKERNKLVKKFNKILGSDFRERATLEIMKERSSDEEVTVFTMGVAHRKNYLKLVNAHLKNTQTAFLFVKAPELRPRYIWQIVILVLALVGIGVTWWLLG